MGEAGIFEVFRNEAQEILNNIENDLVQLEENKDIEIVNRLFRYYHTLKGSSGIVGLNDVNEFTHKLENLLDMVRGGSLEISENLISTLLKSCDWIRSAIFNPDSDADLQITVRSELMLAIENIKNNITSSASEQPKPKFNYFRIKAVFRENIFEFGLDPLAIIEDLFSLGEVVKVHQDRTRLSKLSSLDPEKCYISWKLVLKTTEALQKVKDTFIFVSEDNDIRIDDITLDYKENYDLTSDENPRIGDILIGNGIVTELELDEVLREQQKGNKKIGDIIVKKGLASSREVTGALSIQDDLRRRMETSTVRVDTHKLDNLMNLLGEIVIGQASLNRIAESLDEEKGYQLKNALYGLDRITREFQEQIMSIRMIPVGPTFDQFKRFVRDSSKQMGKEIRLEISGAETELDKTVIEKIGDPLKHMIRNSMDHGIEPVEDRIEAGKDPVGIINLNAYHQEGSVFIEVKDDGRGLDYERIKNKAIAKGIIQKDEEVTEEKLKSLIFLPAFSTSEQVSELSGRGVGMDVVKSNIDSLRGTIEVSAQKGKGSIFRVKLPLTLAIIDGMLFRVGKSTYIVPLLSIVESIRPKVDDVKTVKGKGEVVMVRGEYISLVRLYDFFSITPDVYNPWESLLIVVETNGERLALMIDDLIGQQQIVIKSLESFITQNNAISGATILGDGSVALIIDIHGLLSGIKYVKVGVE